MNEYTQKLEIAYDEVSKRLKEEEALTEKYRNKIIQYEEYARGVDNMVASVVGRLKDWSWKPGNVPEDIWTVFVDGHVPLILMEYNTVVKKEKNTVVRVYHTYARWVGSGQNRYMKKDCDGGPGAWKVTVAELEI